MELKIGPWAAAAALVGFLGFGGASLALAQEDPSTTTPPATDDGSTEDETRPGCDKDGDGTGDGTETSDSSAETSAI